MTQNEREELKRYDQVGCSDYECMCFSEMVESEDGTYVKYEDYSSLLTENQRLRELLRELLDKIDTACDESDPAFRAEIESFLTKS